MLVLDVLYSLNRRVTDCLFLSKGCQGFRKEIRNGILCYKAS